MKGALSLTSYLFKNHFSIIILPMPCSHFLLLRSLPKSIYRHSLTYKISSYISLETVKKWNDNIFKTSSKFSLAEWKFNETKVVEEYCWMITQEAGQSYCIQSGSSVDFNHTSLNIHTKLTKHNSIPPCKKFNLRQTFWNVTIGYVREWPWILGTSCYFITYWDCYTPIQPPSWKTIQCWMSTVVYTTYS
jgi:hypothetical protein